MSHLSSKPSSQLLSRLTEGEIWLHESINMSILIPVMKVRIDEERERILVKEEIVRKFAICTGEVE